MMSVSPASSDRRNYRYVCSTYWNKRASLCANLLMLHLPDVDDTVKNVLMTEAFDATVTERAITRATEIITHRATDRLHVAEVERRLANSIANSRTSPRRRHEAARCR